jgi:hypothetical protein
MRFFDQLRTWWRDRRPIPLEQSLAIEFDDHGARVIVLERMSSDWNQSFSWSDIRRVCFKDGGLYSSDEIYVEVNGRDRPVVVLTEARGGSAFFGALCERGYFPEDVWRRAMGETSGKVYCWPEH